MSRYGVCTVCCAERARLALHSDAASYPTGSASSVPSFVKIGQLVQKPNGGTHVEKDW